MNASPSCWICGGPATTREHKTKKSDLTALFGANRKNRPLFIHGPQGLNKLAQSLNSKLLKTALQLCEPCNSARTQPHDRAWETMSKTLRHRRKEGNANGRVRLNKLFGYEPQRQMLNVHLYFAKLFGCLLVEADGKLPLGTSSFADAIRENRPDPHLFLQFSTGHQIEGRNSTGRSEPFFDLEDDGKECRRLIWLYLVDGFAVALVYVREPMAWSYPSNFWHPLQHRKVLWVADGKQLEAAADA